MSRPYICGGLREQTFVVEYASRPYYSNLLILFTARIQKEFRSLVNDHSKAYDQILKKQIDMQSL